MSRLASVEESQRAERRQAIRLLLRRPLVSADEDPEGFAGLVRHCDWLRGWFADHPGWKLVVDQAGRFARLHKVPARVARTRPAALSNRIFDRRRYALFCLALAALDDAPGQITLARLAEALGELSEDPEGGVRAFDPTVMAERRAFVDALRLLAELGVLRVCDGDAERYAQSREGDVLYDVNERVLGQLLSAPVPPAWARTPAAMLDEPLPDTEEGATLRSRQAVIRRLLEDPVLYYDELTAQEYEWLDHSRGWLYRLLEQEVGLPVERRKEGLAPVDPEGRVSDTLFPDGGSTVKHAALLLAAALVDLRRKGSETVASGDVVERVAGLQADHGAQSGWSKGYPPTADGAARLAEEALGLLEGFGLVARQDDGRWLIRPAIARFAPGEAMPAKRRRR